MFIIEATIMLAALFYAIINIAATCFAPLEKMKEFLLTNVDYFEKVFYVLLLLPTWLLKGVKKVIMNIIA